MSDEDSSADVERIERTDIGTSMEARLKRGTGTRDEDQVTIKAKGEDAKHTIDEFYKLLAEYDDKISDQLRGIQPEKSDS
ncbi:DUF7389 domain-containing protein [Haloarcula sp. GH36]|uniref:DUF7389 domain-containing protein n=1 Tax=Haloarcula montana TaxID=3111776 RepID=UPI002D771446|nr:hypothetical protein [Haloarcula sp. GH36]